jgi:peptidoglycan/LPS O-acetylase OafA/YrhL
MFGLLRTALAIAVVAQHFGPFESIGVMAVYGFFVLSGFLMTLLVTGPYKGRIGAFALNRFLRLYPMYWAVLAATTVVLLLGFRPMISAMGLPHSPSRWIASIAYLTFSAKPPIIVATSWAVTNEIIWYVVIAFGASKTLSRSLLWMSLSVIYTVAIWRFWPNDMSLRYFYFVPGCLPFSIGAVICHLRQLFPKRIAAAATGLGGTGLILVMVPCAIGYWSPWWVIYWLFIPLSAFTILALYNLNVPKWLMEVDKLVGSVSYPIYLNHFMAASLLSRFLPIKEGEPFALLIWVLALSIGLAVLMVAAIDNPIAAIRASVKDGKWQRPARKVPNRSIPRKTMLDG